MIHNVLFDLGGVLIDLDVQRSLDAMHALAKPEHEATQITADGLLGGHDSQLINLYQTGDISTDDFLSAVLRSCREGVTKEQVKDAWFAMLLGVRKEKQTLLRQLHNKGYKIYILSNINELHVEWVLQHCPSLQLADALFFSNEMHLSKPDMRCYQYVLQHTGIVPEQTMYIDDLLPNLEAGKRAGFQCLHAVDDTWMTTLKEQLL